MGYSMDPHNPKTNIKYPQTNIHSCVPLGMLHTNLSKFQTLPNIYYHDNKTNEAWFQCGCYMDEKSELIFFVMF
jgi:hypothetical protein